MLGALVGSFAPAGGSFESIQTITTSSAVNSVTFSSIPQTFKHLQVRIVSRQSTATTDVPIAMRINGATSSYTDHFIIADGTNIFLGGGNATNRIYSVFETTGNGTTWGGGIVDLHDYSSTTKNKTVRGFGGFDLNGSGRVEITSGAQFTTTEVTSISFAQNQFGVSNQFAIGSVFSLYGIKG
jgi:hypothetical protein